MGAYSTIHITKSTAQKYVIENVFKFDDETLARLMDTVLEERLYNCDIVPDSCENDDHILLESFREEI